MHLDPETKRSLGLLLLGLAPGLVFLSEGMQKFLFPDALGTGRFAHLGFTHPAFWATFTACFEIGCACLLFIGWRVRLAVIPLFIVMIVAFVTTKRPELVQKGFWYTAHDYRTDFLTILSLIIIVLLGPGRWAMDHKMKAGKSIE